MGQGLAGGTVCGKSGAGREEEVDGRSAWGKPLPSGSPLAGTAWWEGPQV